MFKFIITGSRGVGKSTLISTANHWGNPSQLIEKNFHFTERIIHRKGTCENYKGIIVLFNARDITLEKETKNSFTDARNLYREAVRHSFACLIYANKLNREDDQTERLLQTIGIKWIYENPLRKEFVDPIYEMNDILRKKQ